MNRDVCCRHFLDSCYDTTEERNLYGSLVLNFFFLFFRERELNSLFRDEKFYVFYFCERKDHFNYSVVSSNFFNALEFFKF